MFEGFGERLKMALKKAGYTQKTATNMLGLSKNDISNYVSGKNPKTENLYKLAKFCNVSMEWLLTGEGKGPDENIKEIDPRQTSFWDDAGELNSEFVSSRYGTGKAFSIFELFDQVTKITTDKLEVKEDQEKVIELADQFKLILLNGGKSSAQYTQMIGRTNRAADDSLELTDREINLINSIRELSPEKQEIVEAFINTMINMGSKSKGKSSHYIENGEESATKAMA